MFRNVVIDESLTTQVDWQEIFEATKRICADATGPKKIFQKESDQKEDFFHRFDEALKNAEVVSFDIFDTALLRLVAEPKDVFYILGLHSPFKELGLSTKLLAANRIDAELRSRDLLNRVEGNADVTLLEIYKTFCEKLNLPAEKAAAFVEAESSIEEKLLIRNEAVFNLYEKALQASKKIVFVSDIYFSRTFLHKNLVRCGYQVQEDHVFSSCEHRMCKANGKLFEVVEKQIGVSCRKFLHIGDNPVSDVMGIEKAGGKGLRQPYYLTGRAPLQTGVPEMIRIESWINGIAQSLIINNWQQDDFWYELGAKVLGPVYTGFSFWLYQQAKERGIQHIYFMLRDGFLLQKVFEVVASAFPEKAPSHSLFYASRRAFRMAAFSCKEPIGTQFLIISGTPRPIGDYLQRLELDPKQFRQAIYEAGLEDENHIVNPASEKVNILQLLQHPDVLKNLRARSNYERKFLLRYLRQEGLFEPTPAAIVDIGWYGTLQKNLKSICEDQGELRSLTGFYLGTVPPDFGDPQIGFSHEGYLCCDGEPAWICKILMEFQQLFEIFCCGDEGSLRYFTEKEGKIAPVLNPFEMSGEQMQKIHRVQKGVLDFAKNFAPEMPLHQINSIPASLAVMKALQLIQYPKPAEAQAICDLDFGDNMGSMTTMKLGALPKDSYDVKDLLKSYNECLWKSGLMNLPSPQAMLLRNILWLANDR